MTFFRGHKSAFVADFVNFAKNNALKSVELLAPAKDFQSAVAAVDYGADAVYIGGAKFGARYAAGNSAGEIARVVEYAHRYGVRVHATLNTLIYDDELEAAGVSTVGLLGTRYTMEQDFYTRKLVERGITVLIPEEDGRAFVNRVIFDELCLGTVSESSRRAFAAIIGGLTARGAQGVILGCTEIGLLVRPGDTSARLFDTTEIHARRAALYAIGEAVPRDGGE